MHIVVDTALNTGLAEFSNLGDVAMLQVGVRRLRRMWPTSRIYVLTDSPANLAVFCPEAWPLPRSGRDLWIGDYAIMGALNSLVPHLLSSGLNKLFRACRLRWPELFRLVAYARLAIRDRRNVRPEFKAFLEVMKQANLFAVCGSGGFTDSSQQWNISTLNMIEEALQRRIPIVMFGQGLGPLTDRDILRRGRRILPKVGFIGLRGGRGQQIVAQSLGLNPDRTPTTGDEAIEIAFAARRDQPGQAIGINLRVATYSNVQNDLIDKLHPVLHGFARRYNAPLIPVPIAFHEWANDPVAIRQLLKGYDDTSDGGITLDTPLKVIQQVGRCRIVITGAYHAAVFALSQGIPVVGLSASEDYSAKFLGLQDQFGLGCETVYLNAADAMERLTTAVERAWQSVEQVRLPLIEAARRQIQLSQGAYERVRANIIAKGSKHGTMDGIVRPTQSIAASKI
jgi:polysaccharide pyruvyl transferase WcaK-like protein